MTIDASGRTLITLRPESTLQPLTQYYVIVDGTVKDLAGNALIDTWTDGEKATHEFTTAADVELSVAPPNMTRSYATANSGFDNGWQWMLNVTVPVLDGRVRMKFADWVSGANSIEADSNIRYYSPQSSNYSSTSTATVYAPTTLNDYDTDDYMILSTDKDSGAAGWQIDIYVEVQLPAGTLPGSYSTSYGVRSDIPAI
jgi:hypothetical protein